ncbi:MAG: hypothetical protein GIKADHBN_03243 [Phycisphaerales bacterium]|nr:hypothetical protein [Phycisphaerales bacterium]
MVPPVTATADRSLASPITTSPEPAETASALLLPSTAPRVTSSVDAPAVEIETAAASDVSPLTVMEPAVSLSSAPPSVASPL